MSFLIRTLGAVVGIIAVALAVSVLAIVVAFAFWVWSHALLFSLDILGASNSRIFAWIRLRKDAIELAVVSRIKRRNKD